MQPAPRLRRRSGPGVCAADHGDSRRTTGTRAELIRATGNLINLSTPFGLLLARAGGCSVRPGPERLRLAEGYRWNLPIAGAFTIGDVILTKGGFAWGRPSRAKPDALPDTVLPDTVLPDTAIPDTVLPNTAIPDTVLAHEARHAWQWAVLGAGFLPGYLAAMTWSWLMTGDLASRNVFERLAGLADGGYVERPRRRLLGSSSSATPTPHTPLRRLLAARLGRRPG